jgi:hypothetical protein
MRVLLALFLSLILAVASVSMAVARGQAPMGASIALCTEAGAITVTLDARGNPISTPPHLCPDCLSAATVFDLPAAQSLAAQEAGSRALTLPAPRLPAAMVARIVSHARGPPALSV